MPRVRWAMDGTGPGPKAAGLAAAVGAGAAVAAIPGALPRRRALRLLAGGAVGAALVGAGLAGAEPAAAGKRYP